MESNIENSIICRYYSFIFQIFVNYTVSLFMHITHTHCGQHACMYVVTSCITHTQCGLVGVRVVIQSCSCCSLIVLMGPKTELFLLFLLKNKIFEITTKDGRAMLKSIELDLKSCEVAILFHYIFKVSRKLSGEALQNSFQTFFEDLTKGRTSVLQRTSIAQCIDDFKLNIL